MLFCEFCEILRLNNKIGPFFESVSHSVIRETTGPFYLIGTILHGVLIICNMMHRTPVVVAALHRLRLGMVSQTRYHSKNLFWYFANCTGSKTTIFILCVIKKII